MNFLIQSVELVDTEVRGSNNNKKIFKHMDEQQYEWVSASTYAKRHNITTPTVYNRIREGLLEAKEFERGTMRGWIIKTLKEENIQS